MATLVQLRGSSRAVREQWAKYLLALELIREDATEHDVALTSTGLALLRTYLDDDDEASALPLMPS